MTPRQPGWLSISAYARHHSVDRTTVYKWLKAGKLTWFREGVLTRVKNEPPTTVLEARPPRLPRGPGSSL